MQQRQKVLPDSCSLSLEPELLFVDWRRNMAEAIIFDIDGTLVDSADLHAKAWVEAFQHYGHQVRFEDVRRQIGKGGDQLLPVFLSKREIDDFGAELEKYRGEIFKERYLPQVTAFPGVRALMERLRADGMRLARQLRRMSWRDTNRLPISKI
jgi:beta-phosphoglucomutase-like phosphatase (HAD superfamily)